MSYAMTVGSAFLQQQKKPSSKFFENLHSYNNFSNRLVIVRKRRFTNVKNIIHSVFVPLTPENYILKEEAKLVEKRKMRLKPS
jgi:hypothetical protein